MARIEAPIVALNSTTGLPVAGASVQIKFRSSGTNATWWTAETGGVSSTAACVTDSAGRISAWLDRGQYNCVVSGSGITTYTEPWDAVSAGDESYAEPAFSTYKTLAEKTGAIAGAATGVCLLGTTGTFLANPVPVGWTGTVFYFDPADFTAATRATKYRVRAQAATNAVAPAATITFGLYPVATTGGASGAHAEVASLGAVVTGSTVAFASPGATTQSQGNSGDFTAPTAGFYVLAASLSTATAGTSRVALRAELQMRQV